NSGTISRGGGNELPSRYLSMKQTRGMVDEGYSEVPKDGQPRDRSLVREDSLTGKVNGVVVLTAASPYQEAVSMMTPDKGVRGAFTYVFEQLIRRNSQEKLADLERDVKFEIKSLAGKGLIKPGGNRQLQEPQFDYMSKTAISDKPLFGSDSANDDFAVAAASALFNPLSPITVRLDVSRTRFRIGQSIDYSVTVGEDLYLYVLVFSAGNKAFCIFPTVNGGDTDNFVRKGSIAFPRGRYETIAGEPVGKDVWVALVSRKKLNIGEKQDYTWDEMFNRIGLDALRNATFDMLRGPGGQKTPPAAAVDWQASSVVVETVAN
ncbi:MAG TPA: DUF4384 domain-containing protein, partial [Pyrinomonadaceae bacterium]|nr:DUF4384 domain-containing protein [Pyrinomonadaceae bacterium]